MRKPRGHIRRHGAGYEAARIKAALARRKTEGKPVGGAVFNRGKDREPRRCDGYLAAREKREAVSRPDTYLAGDVQPLMV